MANKKFDIAKLTLPLMAAIILFALFAFLISRTNGVSGFDALKMQNASFWVFGILGVVAAVAVGYLAAKNNAEGGASGKTIILVLLALILLTAPFGKACSSKADPVTSPGYKNPAP